MFCTLCITYTFFILITYLHNDQDNNKIMKLSTIAAALLLSSEAYAAQEVGRMRKVKIYSSSTLLRNVELGRDVVDPYIGLPDERGQRGLEKQLPVPPIALEMSPATSSNDKSFSLEMSMPATSSNDQSVPYLPVQGGANAVVAKAESAENSAMTTGHSSVAAVATIVSAIAGVVAFV
jgi:hypothetical protein